MKRLIAIILTVALIASCGILPITSQAASTLTVTTESKSAFGGEIIEIRVIVNNNDGFCYLKVNPLFDDSVMTLIDAVNGEVSTDDYEFTGKNILWSSDDDTMINGVLVTYTFQINENAVPGSYDVGIKVRECYNMNEEDVEVAVGNGKVTIEIPQCPHTSKTEVPSKGADCVNIGNNLYFVCDSCGMAFKADGVTETTAEAETIPSLGHDLTDADCMEAAKCKREGCSHVEGTALGHSFTNYVSNGDATCTADGTKTAKCDRCDVTDTTADNGSAKGHDFADATCTAPKTCKVCGATEGTALGHSFTNYVSNGDATCTADGTKTAKCDRCDVTDTTTDSGSVKDHDFADATCTAPKTCKVCGATEGTALGHSFTNYVSNGDATCTADGTKTAKCDRCDVTDTTADSGSAKGHDWADATCTAPKTCKVCGATEGTALGHSFTNYVSNNDATCTKDGTKTAKCDRCDVTDTTVDADSAKGHSYAAAWSKGEDGHWHECSACGDKTDFADHNYGDGDKCILCEYERAHIHRLTLVGAVDATCTTDGNAAYYTCSGCENWFEDASGSVAIADKTSVAIAALGHDLTDATCTEAPHCKREGCSYTEGSALGHSFTNYVSNNDATCTKDGTKTAKCDRCDVVNTVTDTGSAKGHNYIDATCTAAKTCKVCGVTEGNPLGHSYAAAWSMGEEGHWHECVRCRVKTDEAAHYDNTSDDKCDACGYELDHVHHLTMVGAVDATCTTDGNAAYYTCSGCENWFEDASGSIVISDKTSVVISALGHDLTDATCSEAPHCKREGCAYTEGTALGHDFEAGWTYDTQKHWHNCSRCESKHGEEDHIPGAEATEETAQTCTICGYEIAPALGHTHVLTKVDATVSCTEAGNIAYYVCGCGKWFADEDGAVEITDKDSVKSNPLGHTDANKDGKCDTCKAKIENNQPTNPSKPTDKVPQTGDISKSVLWAVVLILSVAGTIVCALFIKKKSVA